MLPLIFAKANHIVTVYDVRQYPERHKNLTIIKADFLANNLPPNSFDVAILISTSLSDGTPQSEQNGYSTDGMCWIQSFGLVKRKYLVDGSNGNQQPCVKPQKLLKISEYTGWRVLF